MAKDSEANEDSGKNLYFDIVYAEKSFIPKPAEVTYVGRWNVREYDYYVILRLNTKVGELLIPILIEDLTTPIEVGGKSAIDRLLGVSAPVVYIHRRRSENVSAGQTSWSFPIVFGGNLGNSFLDRVERVSRKSMYIQIVARDFWEEVAEAQMVYAPSIYLKYIARPVRDIAKKVLEMLSQYQIEASSIVKNYWRVLKWRMGVESTMLGSRDTKSGGLEEASIVDIDTYLDMANGTGYTAEIPGLNGCEKILFVFPLFALANIARESDFLRQELKIQNDEVLHPALATLTAPLIPIVAKMCSPSLCCNRLDCEHIANRIAVVVIHDYDYYDPDFIKKLDRIIQKLAGYIANVVRCVAGLEISDDKIDVLSMDSKVDWLNIKKLTFDIPKTLIVSIKPMEIDSKIKRFASLTHRDVKDLVNEITSKVGDCVSGENICTVFIVRDTEKRFLDSLLKLAVERFKDVYFVYSPENIAVHIYELAQQYACRICSGSMDYLEELIGSMEIVSKEIILPLDEGLRNLLNKICKDRGGSIKKLCSYKDGDRIVCTTLKNVVTGKRCYLDLIYSLASSIHINVFRVKP
ncbi:hypothetical protein Igag_0611 [Ignisphaera aggregans DSM 17230]|uniref:Uncharacterized protein n=1 Tax=Ignisphaera aggregans (strain DSM 17230 / JCM 13409 / AQ1.S1) TaxID=583356 RepID=E0SSH3_IGNAA|nr:hypothetical protein Igag_0611 [Ignisphaera aggregans DSM 17230]